jgi:hypothetical protein
LDTVTDSTGTFTAADEALHRFDPDEWSWNESWYCSWIDLDGGPAGFFRVGVLPNQRRAMLWAFVHVDGEWLGTDESRLAYDDLDLTSGVAYDRWGLRFAYHPDPPLLGARFGFAGSLLARTGPRAGAFVPVSVELACRSTTDCFGTGTGDDGRVSAYARSRFEQSLEASGTVVVDGVQRTVRAGAHRDRSWGPREWRVAFTLGDLQSGQRQLYFVGAPGHGLGGGYLRDRSGGVRRLVAVDGSIDYDDDARTITPGRLGFQTPDGTRVDVELAPASPSVAFDMAHTCQEPEQWLYWRSLVEARVTGWDRPCRGWLEASRYGCR